MTQVTMKLKDEFEVYGVLCPHCIAVVYVGVTHQPLGARMQGHKSARTNLGEWINKTLESGMGPIAITLEKGAGDQHSAESIEMKWIKRISERMPLLNGGVYLKHDCSAAYTVDTTVGKILAELHEQRDLIEQLLRVVPGAVTSEDTKREEREQHAWVLEMAKRSRMKAAGK